MRSQLELVVLSLSLHCFSLSLSLFFPLSLPLPSSLSLSVLFYSIPSHSLCNSFPSYSSTYSLPPSSFLVCIFVLAISLSRLRSLGQLTSKLASPRPSTEPQLLAHFPSPSDSFSFFLFSPFVLPSFLALFHYLSFHLFFSLCSVCSMCIIYTSLAPDHRAVARVLVQPAKVRILIFV